MVIAATSSATTVATFTSTGNNTALQLTDNSTTFTSGTILNIGASGTAITTGAAIANGGTATGSLLNISATGALTSSFTGNLATIDWSPTSSATALGDLLHINIGTNGNIGNLLNITDQGATDFSVSETQITSALPHQFTAAGDVSMAYDLNFTNQTTSNIISNAPLAIVAGETFESNNLTLTTYNTGNILLNTGLTGGRVGVGAGITAVGLLTVNSAGETASIGKATFIVNQTESQDIIAASSSGTTKFTVSSAGKVLLTLDGTASTAAICGSQGNGTSGDQTGVTLRDCSGTPALDYAEMYPTESGINYGDIVVTGNNTANVRQTDGYGNILAATSPISKLTKSSLAYQGNVIGIVSNNYGDFSSTGHNVIDNADNPFPVALSGHVPVKVSPSSQAISIGDYLTTSSDAGMAMKATQSGRIIGTALNSWTPNSGQDTVNIFINNSYYVANNPLNGSGNLSAVADTQNAGYYQLKDNNGNLIDKLSGIVSLLADNIKAGYAEVATLVSPTIQTQVIKPTTGTNDLAFQLGDQTQTATQSGFGKLLIQDRNGNTVSSFDEQGNATISGQLTADSVSSQELAVNSATVSGDLHVGKIYADEIVARNTASENIQAASISGITREDIEKMLADAGVGQQNLNTGSWSANTATGSAMLNELALENLYVTGQAAINSLSLTQSLTVGNDMVISSAVPQLNSSTVNSIDTLTAPLSLQSSASQPLYLMAGLVQIDTQGNVQVAGNLAVGGSVSAKGLTLSASTQASGFGKLLTVNDQNGSEVAAISATGAATLATVQTNALSINDDPTATSSATFDGLVFTTNASAGTAKVPSGSREVIIKNPNITAKSLVFVTPTSSTLGTLYIKEQLDGQVKVGFDAAAANDVTFNWWIVGLTASR